MSVMLGFAIYFILWWTVLFAVLPFGVRSQKEAGLTPGMGTDHGAPAVPMLLKKVAMTTIVSAILFGAGYMIWKAGWVSLDSIPMPYKDIKL
jgi:predicted secreted protein